LIIRSTRDESQPHPDNSRLLYILLSRTKWSSTHSTSSTGTVRFPHTDSGCIILTWSKAQCIYSKQWNALPPSNTSSTTIAKPTVDLQKLKHPYDDASKLIFGVVFSLRNISRRLGGDDNSFLCYRTAQYKLHYYETLTRLKFVMITDTKMNNLQLILHQIWATLYVEYVVKNPLSPVEHGGGIGVANELFESALERFVQTTLL
jgi:trafficking protein particle complex subunit 1